MIPNHYCGKLIAIDGPNGAGKSTIINGLKSRLAQLAISSYFTKEPTESEIGSFTRRFAESNSGLPLAYLVGADRYYHLEKEIIPKLQEGFFVFTDRYVLSSLILQCMDGVSSEQICQINDNAIMPDLQIVVWAAEETLQARLKERKVLTRFEQGEQSGNELAMMQSGVDIFKSMGVNCLHIYNDSNLNDSIECVVKRILGLGEGNGQIHSY